MLSPKLKWRGRYVGQCLRLEVGRRVPHLLPKVLLTFWRCYLFLKFWRGFYFIFVFKIEGQCQ